MAGCTPSIRLLLCIIRLFIAWAEGAAASLRQRTETAALAELMRAYGTTDTALIMQRVTHVLLRLRALEAKVLHSAGLHADTQLERAAAASSARSPSASQPPGFTPRRAHVLPLSALKRRIAAPVRATGPPRPQRARANRNGASPSSHTEGHGGPRHADSPTASHLPSLSGTIISQTQPTSSPRQAGTQASQTSLPLRFRSHASPESSFRLTWRACDCRQTYVTLRRGD